jgi:hypothetical protein
MRERAAMLGGALTAESRPDGGYQVFARLPAAGTHEGLAHRRTPGTPPGATGHTGTIPALDSKDGRA